MNGEHAHTLRFPGRRRAGRAGGPGRRPGLHRLVAGSTLSFAAVDGEANDVTVAFAPGTYTITDAGAPVSAGTCTQVNPATVSCRRRGSRR